MINKLWLWLRFTKMPMLHNKTRITPLGSLTYRQVNTAVKLEDGIKRARKREYFKPKVNA
jgi:hypothetical protein